MQETRQITRAQLDLLEKCAQKLRSALPEVSTLALAEIEKVKDGRKGFVLTGLTAEQIASKALEDDRDIAVELYDELRRALGYPQGEYQVRVGAWAAQVFGGNDESRIIDRADRLLEEVLELLQSLGYAPVRVQALTDYVFNRPKGEPGQELGGVMVTLAALSACANLDMEIAGEAELERVNRPDVIAKIKAKNASQKPGSPVPGTGEDLPLECSDFEPSTIGMCPRKFGPEEDTPTTFDCCYAHAARMCGCGFCKALNAPTGVAAQPKAVADDLRDIAGNLVTLQKSLEVLIGLNRKALDEHGDVRLDIGDGHCAVVSLEAAAHLAKRLNREDQIESLAMAGQLTSNCCYNLAQQEGKALTKADCDSMRESADRWDRVRRDVPPKAGA